MNAHRALVTGFAGLLLVAAPPATAEPVTPPPGSIAGTGATQILNLPYTISQPGSYRLARNFVYTGSLAINIVSDDVVLDLGGHNLSGGGAGATAIEMNNRSSITIRNGSMEDWLGNAITASGSGSPLTIEDMQFRSIGGNAIAVFLSTAIIRNCIVEDIGVNAVATGQGSVVENVTIRGAAFDGLVVASDVTIRNSHVFGAGSNGFRADDDCVFEGCTASLNGVGFSLRLGGVLENCTAAENLSVGVLAARGAIIRGVTAQGNGFGAAASVEAPFWGTSTSPEGTVTEPFTDPEAPDRGAAALEIDPRTGEVVAGAMVRTPTTGNDGIRVGLNSLVADCVAEGNAEDGIAADSGSRITGCVSRSNGATGINVADDCAVSDSIATSNTVQGVQCLTDGDIRRCVASNNGGNGIGVADDALVMHCKSEGNTGAGIYNSGTGTVIDTNHVAQNTGFGIESTNSFVVVVRNTLELDTLSVAGATRVGPLNDINNPWTNWQM